MAIYKPTDCSPFNGVFDVMDDDALPIYLECKIDSANTPVSAYRIEVYNSENIKVFPVQENSIENSVTMISDLKSYTSGDPFNIKAPINTGYNGTYLKIPFVVKSVTSESNNTVNRNQVAAGQILTNGGKYYWTITLYQEITKGQNGNINLPTKSKYYDMPVVSGQVIGSNASRLQTELVPQTVKGYQTLSDLVLQDKYVQLYKENDEANGARTLISSFDYLYGHIMPSNTSINTITDDMVNTSSYLKVFKFGNDPSVLGTTDKVDIFYNGEIPRSGEKIDQAKWTWESSLADASQSYWKEEVSYNDKPTVPYFPFGSNGPQISGNERIIFNNCAEKQYNGIFYPNDISVEEVKGTEESNKNQVIGYTLKILWNRTTDANNWGSLSNKIVYVNGMSYGTVGSYAGTNVQIDAFQQFGTINQTPFNFVQEKPIKLRNKVNADLSSKTQEIENNQITFEKKEKISTISSIVIDGNTIPVQNYVFELGSNKITLYGKDYSGTATVSYYSYDENEYKTAFFKNTPLADGKDGILYIRPSTSITKDMIFKELTSTIYSRWFRILDFNTDFYYVTYNVVYKYAETYSGTEDKETTDSKDLKFDIGTRYQIKSFFKKSDYNPFDLYLAPEINIVLSLIGRDDPVERNDEDGTYEITRRNISATATYLQDDYIWWESYQWILYSMNDRWQKAEVLQKTEETYSGEIKCDFYGLTGKDANGVNSRYYLTLIIKTNVGAVIEKNLVLVATFGETQFDDKIAESNFDCDLLAVDININTSTNFIVPSFSKKYVFDNPDEADKVGSVFESGDKTYVITPSEKKPAISKVCASDEQVAYQDMQETMRYDSVKNDGFGKVTGFQNYGKSAFIINDGTEEDPASTNVKNTSFEDIDVVEKDMVVEAKITINPKTNDADTREYVGDIFSIKDDEADNKIALVAPAPVTENGLVEKNRNKLLWSHSGIASFNMVAKNRGKTSDFWQGNEAYVTVSIYQPEGFVRDNNTNLEDIKYINDDGTEDNYGKDYNESGKGNYINMSANISDGGATVGYSTYKVGEEDPYVVHEIFTKQSAFENNEKYTANFMCEGLGNGTGANLCVRGKYSSMFSVNDNPAKPYNDRMTDVVHDVIVGKDKNGNIETQKKSVLLDSDSRIYFYDSDYKLQKDTYDEKDEKKVFFFYSGRYYQQTSPRAAGALMINERAESAWWIDSKAYTLDQYSSTGLQKIVKNNRTNPERQNLNNKALIIKADVGVGMEVDERRQGYWISGGDSN